MLKIDETWEHIPNEGQPPTISLKEAAFRLGISAPALMAAAKAGEISFYATAPANHKETSALRFTDDDLKRYVLLKDMLGPDEIARRAVPREFVKKQGVYFLIADGEVVYVGQSSDIATRINQHWRRRRMSFDSVYYIEHARDEINMAEALYIAMLRPKLNKAVPDTF